MSGETNQADTSVLDNSMGNVGLWSEALRQSPFCLMVIRSSDGCLIEISNSVLSLTGFKASELRGKLLAELDLWPDPKQPQRIWEALAESGRTRQLEVDFQPAAGGKRAGLFSAQPLKHQGADYWAAGLSDITPHKQELRRLQESEERLRFLAENTGDALYRLPYDSMNYDYLSTGVTTLTGYTPKEINEIGFASLVKMMESAGAEEISKDYVRGQRREGRTGEYRADYLIETKSGETKWLGDHSFPWLDDQGKVVGSLGILTDITERKMAQQEYLLREKLQAAVQTAGAACHELNQPLQAVSMQLELLIMKMKPGDPIEESLETILEQVRRMGEITHRLNRITDFRLREYVDGINILDLDSSSS